MAKKDEEYRQRWPLLLEAFFNVTLTAKQEGTWTEELGRELSNLTDHEVCQAIRAASFMHRNPKLGKPTAKDVRIWVSMWRREQADQVPPEMMDTFCPYCGNCGWMKYAYVPLEQNDREITKARPAEGEWFDYGTMPDGEALRVFAFPAPYLTTELPCMCVIGMRIAKRDTYYQERLTWLTQKQRAVRAWIDKLPDGRYCVFGKKREPSVTPATA